MVCIVSELCPPTSFSYSDTSKLVGIMDNHRELRIHENLDDLRTDLAEYIEELSEVSVKERGVFAITLTGGSLISLMG